MNLFIKSHPLCSELVDQVTLNFGVSLCIKSQLSFAVSLLIKSRLSLVVSLLIKSRLVLV